MQKDKPAIINSSRPTIGLLIDWLGGIYQLEVWSGIEEAARALDVNLISYSGGSLKSPYGFLAQSNVIYDLVNESILDGLIIASGAISDYISHDEILAFCQQFQPLPVVSIALEFEAIPSVLVDNRVGMLNAVRHLLNHHGLKHIAFIRASVGHQEADDRFSAYQEALDEAGISFDENLVAIGDFSMHSGIEATRELLSRNIAIEAIVAADDNMILGALIELQRQGIEVPGDIALVGFDDVEETHFSVPPITTVHQPIQDQASKALELVLAQINGQVIPAKTFLPTDLVVRRSCGCGIDNIDRIAENHLGSFASTSVAKDALLSEIVHILSPVIAPDFAGETQFVNTFFKAVDNNDGSVFFDSLRDLMNSVNLSRNSLSVLQNLVSTFRRYIRRPSLSDVKVVQAENILHQARIQIAGYIEQQHGKKNLEISNRNLIHREIGQGILSTLDMSELLEVIAENISEIDMKSCFIALYTDQNPALEKSQLLFFYEQDKPENFDIEQKVFLSKELLPDNMLRFEQRRSLIVESLYFREEQLGFVVFEMDGQDSQIFATLRQQISSALKGALLLKRYEQKAEELTKYRNHLEELVENRTKELTKTNERLEQEIHKRSQVEQEIRELNSELEQRVEARTAELIASNERLEILSQAKDQFVSNVSHELRTPITNISLYLQLLARRPERLTEYREILSHETERLSELIEALLVISRIDQSQVEVRFETININNLISKYVHDRTLLAEEKDIQLLLEIEDVLPVTADRHLVGQILSVFLTNALNYTPGGGKITIKSQTRGLGNQQWTGICVIDTGPGIPLDEQEHLFSRFYRGNAGQNTGVPGTGLGLAIAKEICDLHGGQIEINSDGIVGHGASFCLWLPGSMQKTPTSST